MRRASMSDDILIRKYSPEDYDACRSLWAELTEWHRQIYSDDSIGSPDPAAHFDDHLSRAGADRLLVAESESKVIGLTGLMLHGDEAEVEPLVVSASVRSRGIGSLLLEAVVNEARKLGVSYLSVRPVARNAEAIAFFRGSGFVNIGHVELFMDFSERRWTPGVRLHDLDFHY